jgi:tetratricopeptide (TPR) repeat protein
MDNAPNWQVVTEETSALIDKGREHQRNGRYEEALAHFEEAIGLCRGLSAKFDPVALALAQALDNKAGALMDLERLSEAILCFNEAIQVHEGIVRGDEVEQAAYEIAVSVMNKGIAFLRLRHSEEALACFEQALDGFHQCESDEDAARALLNSGEVYIRQGHLDEALATYEKSLAVWEAVTRDEPDDDMADYAYTLYGKADVLHRLERYGEALDLSDRSIALHRAVVNHANRLKEREGLAVAVNLRGHILTKLGRTNEAQECFREAAQLKRNAARVHGEVN